VVLSFMGSGRASESVDYHGTIMRSHLEADYAKHLDLMGVKWTYEPRVFDGYLPDFQVELGDRPCFVEVKPTIAEAEGAMHRMAPIWKSEPRAFLVIACAEGSTFFGANRETEWIRWNERWAHS
jgi:hypothetical protein